MSNTAGGRAGGEDPGPGLTIVVGVDGSPSSAAALRWAGKQARLMGATLHVVMAWQPVDPDVWPVAAVPSGDPALESRLALRRVVAQAFGDPPPPELVTESIRGPAAPVLLEVAQEATLLVLGDRGRGGFAGLRLGSVGHHCVTYAPCPVVIVREPAEEGMEDEVAVPAS